MKKMPRNLVWVTVSNGNTISECARKSEKLSETIRDFDGRRRKRGGLQRQAKEDVPLLVTVNEPRRNRADVRAGTNEQEDDEQEGLEAEERGLRLGGSACKSRQSVLEGN
jgi:hypothetical protein